MATTLEVNGVLFRASDDEFSEMVSSLAQEIFDAAGVEIGYDEELEVDTEAIFDNFRYDELENAVLDAVQDAIDKVRLDFTDKYRDEILKWVKEAQ